MLDSARKSTRISQMEKSLLIRTGWLVCHFSTHACTLFAFIIEPPTTDTGPFIVTNLFGSSLLSQVVHSELSHVEVA
jgi:hypothetical protein